MGELRPRIPKVKLFCGILFREEEVLRRALRMLERRLGPVEDRSAVWPFEETDYYEAEMGRGLWRVFVSFRRLVRREAIVGIKRFTNRVEGRLCSGWGGRRVNLDPGYVTLANVCLATTKDFQHRVWLGGGVYLENTLRRRRGVWADWEWTYPDYRRPEVKAWFEGVYRRYREALRVSGGGG